MKFEIEINNDALREIKEFQEQAGGIFSTNWEQVITQLFFLADMGSGWINDLTDKVKVTAVSQ
jgi:hypothetical protein